MRYIPILFLIIFDQIDAIFDFPMDVIIVRCIQIPPKDIFLVEHQFEKLNKEVISCCIQTINRSVYFTAGLAFISEGVN